MPGPRGSTPGTPNFAKPGPAPGVRGPTVDDPRGAYPGGSPTPNGAGPRPNDLPGQRGTPGLGATPPAAEKSASQQQPQQEKGATQPQPGGSQKGASQSMPGPTSGRVMPGGGYNSLLNVNRGTPYNGSISPVDVNVEGLGLDRYQQFADEAYESQLRRLDPQFESADARFRQQMVNQGLSEGTEAYDAARANFDRTRTDAYGQARTMADQLGMAMQQQAFGQNLSESQLANALAQARMSMNATLGASRNAANASMYGADTQRFLGQLGNQLGWGNLLSDTALGFGNLGLGHGQLDLANRRSDQDFYLGLGNLGVNQFNANNAAQQGWMGNIFQALGMVPGSGIPGIDVTGPYQNFYNNQLGQFNADQARDQQRNQFWTSFFLCDRDAKRTIGEIAPETMLEAVQTMPVDHWAYTHDDSEHVGPYAQPFYASLGLPERRTIDPVDALGVVLGAIKALTKRVEALEA